MFMQHLFVEVAWNFDAYDDCGYHPSEKVYRNARICNILENATVLVKFKNVNDETVVKLKDIRLQPKYNNRDFVRNTVVEVFLKERDGWTRKQLRQIEGNKVMLEGESYSSTPIERIRHVNPNPNWSPDNFKYYRRQLTDDNLKAFEDIAVITQFCLDAEAFFARIEQKTRTLVVIFFNKRPIIREKILNAYFPPATESIDTLSSISSTANQIPFVEELECPVCMTEMQPPIRMCVSGHSICTPCKDRLNKCPVCRREFIGTRNLALESLAIKQKVILVNQGKYKCPENDCNWMGAKSSLVDHWSSHLSPIHFDEEIALGDIFNTFCRGTTLIIAYNDYFWFKWLWNSTTVYCSVQYVGPAQDAQKYSYRLKIGDDKMMMERRCESVDLDDNDLLASNGLYCCVVTFDAIKRYKTSTSYGTMLEIIKN